MLTILSHIKRWTEIDSDGNWPHYYTVWLRFIKTSEEWAASVFRNFFIQLSHWLFFILSLWTLGPFYLLSPKWDMYNNARRKIELSSKFPIYKKNLGVVKDNLFQMFSHFHFSSWKQNYLQKGLGILAIQFPQCYGKLLRSLKGQYLCFVFHFSMRQKWTPSFTSLHEFHNWLPWCVCNWDSLWMYAH